MTHPIQFEAAGQPVVSKAGAAFALCGHDGDIDSGRDDAEGLYHHDMRYLDRLSIRLHGDRLRSLLAWSDGDNAGFELARPLRAGLRPGARELAVRRVRRFGGEIEETIQLTNFASEEVVAELEVEAGSSFDDMFTIRNGNPGRRGRLHAPRWDRHELVLEYDGADQRTRRTRVAFEPGPDRTDGGRAHFTLEVGAHQEATVSLRIRLEDVPTARHTGPERQPGRTEALTAVQVSTSNAGFDEALSRSLEDLRMLVTAQHGLTFVAAGMPWFAALFGRDSLVAALETIAFDPSLARDTLELLARLQGEQEDEQRGEQPGKILHELRVGEKAHLGEIPQRPSYRTVDATPLFLVLLGEYLDWTGDLDTARRLRGSVERALGWIDRYGDSDGDGFVDYSSGPGAPHNEGWKDSDNAIANDDASWAEQPIALVEVQGYVYAARLAAARVLGAIGAADDAERQRREADELRERFDRAYRWEEEDFYYLALQRGGRPVRTVASNPGQALWTGIVAAEHAGATARRLLQPDSFSGWGVRTLAAGQAAYNPIDYQVGAVWPHDNALIAGGLFAGGFVAQGLAIFEGMLAAATHFPGRRLPELFAGEDRRSFPAPVRYPHACSPQAWAAGALPHLLRSALGLRPAALEGRLEVSPHLPGWLAEVEVRNLGVGGGSVDLRFRVDGDATEVETLRADGVRVETRRT